MNHTFQKPNYNDMVNPISATGQVTLEMLAQTGNPDAIEYKRILNIGSAIERDKLHVQNNAFSPEEHRTLMAGFRLGVEARYAAVSDLLKASGYQNMLDIACGYTPRALMCHKEGFDYVGVDLPAVVDCMKPVSQTILRNMTHPAYVCGDVTNAGSLKKAADMLDGELFISSEGLMCHLDQSELKQMLLAIRQVLIEHGGAWYSSDMEVRHELLAATAVNTPDALARWARNIHFQRENKDLYLSQTGFKNVQETVAFFEDMGLKVERIPFYTDQTQLNTLQAFDPQSRNRLKKLMESFHFWKITAATDSPASQAGTRQDLDIRYTMTDGTLLMKLDGRLDTLSAPALMELLDTLAREHQLTDLVFDLQKLDYMSSAGMRILLQMAKRLGSDHVFVENLNDMMRGIFENTGFTKVVTLR